MSEESGVISVASDSLRGGQGRLAHRNQVKRLLKQALNEIAEKNVNSLGDNLDRLVLLARGLYPREEVDSMLPSFTKKELPTFPTYKEERIQKLITIVHTAQALLEYVDSRMGNPIVQDYLIDSLNKAEDALNHGFNTCAAIMTRIALEQALRAICELNSVPIKGTPMAGRMNDALKEAGVFEKHYWRMLQVKLDRLSDPVHGGPEPSADLVRSHITWVANFVEMWLMGRPTSQATEENQEQP